METINESSLECDWYITNLIEPSTDPSYNRTLCEEYFSSIKETYATVLEASDTDEQTELPTTPEYEFFGPTTLKENIDAFTLPTEADLEKTSYASYHTDDFGTTLEDENASSTAAFVSMTEASSDIITGTEDDELLHITKGQPLTPLKTFTNNFLLDLTPDFSDDTTTELGDLLTSTDDSIGQTTNEVMTTTDFNLTMNDMSADVEAETFDRLLRLDFQEDTSPVEDISTTVLHHYNLDESVTTVMEDFSQITTDRDLTTTTLSPDTTEISEFFNQSTVVSETLENLQEMKSKISHEAAGVVTDFLNDTMKSTSKEDQENFVYNKSTDLGNLQVMRVNNTLCDWYLPTVEQTPIALGSAGIALWILGFLITFILIFLFAKQAYFIYRTSHKAYRRHLYSITSIYMVMSLLTSIGSGIPRAHDVCSAVKDVYMAIGIGHFVDLTIAMYGGENVMHWHLKDKTINVRGIILCKCFLCIPKCKVRRISVSILKWIVWQMKWSQALYYILQLIWVKAMENSLGITLKHEIPFWMLNILNIISFVSGVMALLIIGNLVTDDLQDRYNYSIKAKLVRFTILTTKFQRLLFEVLEAFNVFPCIPPYVSKKFYKNVLKDFIYLVEVLVIGVFTYVSYFRRGEFEQANSSEVPKQLLEKGVREPPTEENGDVDVDVTVPLNRREPYSESNC